MEAETPKKGRPPVKRQEDVAKQVQALAQYGVPVKDIAAYIGMSKDTMAGLYREELDRGQAVANAQVGKRLYEKCMKGDTASLIFWAKTRMGWRETQHLDVSNTDGSLRELPKAVQVILVEAKKDKGELDS